MFRSDQTIWQNISNFATDLGISKKLIERAKLDYDNLITKYTETRRLVLNLDRSKFDTSLSMQEFFRWGFNYFPCFLYNSLIICCFGFTVCEFVSTRIVRRSL